MGETGQWWAKKSQEMAKSLPWLPFLGPIGQKGKNLENKFFPFGEAS